MSQKSDIEELLEAGRGYDEIEDTTGSNRSYIRSIAVQYRKGSKKTEIPEQKDEPTREEENPQENPSLNFIDDNNPPPVEKSNSGKSGGDYHKEWVKAAKYECGHCGATVGKTTTFCPHCGKSLEWGGIE